MTRYDHRAAEIYQPTQYLTSVVQGNAGYYGVTAIGDLNGINAGLLIHDINIYCDGDDLFWGTFTYPGGYTWTPGYTSRTYPVSPDTVNFIASTQTPTEITTDRVGMFTRWMEVKDINILVPAGTFLYISPSDEEHYYVFTCRVRMIAD